MRYLLLLGLLACLSDLTAQEIRSGFGLDLYPQLSTRRLAASGFVSQDEIDRLEEREIVRPSYAVGLFYSRRAEKIGFRIGLDYANVGYRSKVEALPEDSPDRPVFASFRDGFVSHQLQVPMSVQFYQELSPGSDFFFEMGLLGSYALGQKEIRTLYAGERQENERSEPEGDYRGANFGFQTAMGWEKTMGRNWVLSLRPTFQFWLRGLKQNDADVNRNLYNVGLRIGISRMWSVQ